MKIPTLKDVLLEIAEEQETQAKAEPPSIAEEKRDMAEACREAAAQLTHGKSDGV